MTNEAQEILREINVLQKRLVELIEEKDLRDGEVLKVSQALDRLINDFYRYEGGRIMENRLAEHIIGSMNQRLW